MKRIQLHTILLVFIFCSCVKGQTKNGFSKTDLPKNDTKPEADITSPDFKSITRTVIQDTKGNMWIATFGGVFRYDGKSFTNMLSKVSSARFFSVLEDRNGNFWFASIGSGVYYYNGKSFRNFTTKDGLANDRVPHIYKDKKGNIWFGTEGGASRYDGKSFQNFTMAQALPYKDITTLTDTKSLLNAKEELNNNDVNSIIEDKTGKFWFATRGNVFTYACKKFSVFTHNGTPFTNVRTLIEDKKGNIWFAGSDGLWRYNGSTFTNFTRKFVGYVYEDRKGNIWTSSESANDKSWVVSRYDEKSLSSENPTATIIKSGETMVFGIVEATDGGIWFGTLEGVYRYDGKTFTDFKRTK